MLHSPQRPLHTNMLGGALTYFGCCCGAGGRRYGGSSRHPRTNPGGGQADAMCLDLECKHSTAGCVNKQLTGHRLTTCDTMITATVKLHSLAVEKDDAAVEEAAMALSLAGAAEALAGLIARCPQLDALSLSGTWWWWWAILVVHDQT